MTGLGFNNSHILELGLNIRDVGINSPAHTLLNNCLVAYWNLDEASGVRFDSTSNNLDLTDINTVGSALGVIGNGASFIAGNSEQLHHPNDALLINDAFTVSGWVRFPDDVDTLVVYQVVKNSTFPFPAAAIEEYSISYNPALSEFSFNMQNSGGSPTTAVFPISIDEDDQYHFVATFDGVNLQLHVNDVAGTAVPLVGTPAWQVHAGGPFAIGEKPQGASQDADKTIDEVGIWCRVLTAEEITYLFCNRIGVTYDFSAPNKGQGGFTNGFDDGFWGTSP